MAIVVRLTLPEMSAAMNAAWLRIVTSASAGLNHKTTYSRPMSKRVQEEFVGACGELAVGKAVGDFFVPSVGTFHRLPDCMEDCEVRSTDRDDGCLIIRNNDAGNRRYIFAVATGEEVKLVGWMRGADAKRTEWKRNPNGYREAWFVPQSALLPIEEIIEGTRE